MTKPFNSAIKVLILVTIVFYTGACGDDYKISLTVYPDGSLEKTVEWTTSSDNPQTDEPIFPLHIDSSWTITNKGKTVKKTVLGNAREVWTFQASKKFESVEELNQEYKTKQKIRLSPSTEFRKQFKGIFTTFTFRETYPTVYLFRKIPASKYLSEEDIKLINAILEDEEGLEGQITESQQKEIEKKSEIWMRHSLFEEFFSLLLQETGKMNDSSLTKQMLLDQTDQILSNFSKLNKDEIFKVNIKNFLDEYAETEGNPAFTLLWQNGKSAFITFENELKAIDKAILDNYTNHITMPGHIVSTNAPTVSGSTVTWEIPFLTLLFREMGMEVESRLLNWWIIGLGIPVLLLVIMGLASMFRYWKHR